MMSQQEIFEAADRYLATHRPVVTAPRGTPLPEPSTDERYLVAQDGMYLQVKRPWALATVQVAEATLALPFGSVAESLQLRCGPLPFELIGAFLATARQALPCEAAAWIVWHESLAGTAQAWSVIPLRPSSASADHITFIRPPLPEGTHRVIDIHSHGAAPAFFSAVDDSDDSHASEVYLAAVLGNVDTATPSVAMRLCVLGHTRPLGSQMAAQVARRLQEQAS